MNPEFVYEYLVYQKNAGKRNLIAEYFSNAIPPSIGSILNLSQYLKDQKGLSRFRVIAIEEFPTKKEDDSPITSSNMCVEITVELV